MADTVVMPRKHSLYTVFVHALHLYPQRRSDAYSTLPLANLCSPALYLTGFTPVCTAATPPVKSSHPLPATIKPASLIIAANSS